MPDAQKNLLHYERGFLILLIKIAEPSPATFLTKKSGLVSSLRVVKSFGDLLFERN